MTGRRSANCGPLANRPPLSSYCRHLPSKPSRALAPGGWAWQSELVRARDAREARGWALHLRARKVRHVWVDVLQQPEKWEAFARPLKLANKNRPAFQEEFTRAVPGWKTL